MKNNFETFKKDFKRDLLVKVVVALKFGHADRAGAAKFAQDTIGIFDTEEPVQMFAAINKLSETHPEILAPFIKRGSEYDEREKIERMQQIMRDLKMKGGELI